MPISRRSFLKSSAAVTALSMTGGAAKSVLADTKAAIPFAPAIGNKWPGKVVVNFNKNAVTGNETISDAQIVVIKKMVDDSIKALANKSTVAEAWKAIFPDTLTKDSKIAIKTNFYATSSCKVHWSVVQAMTEGLQQMDFGGTKFPAANITIFEGNVPAANTLDGAGYTAERFPGVKRVIDTFDKSAPDPATGEANGYATSLKNADFFMNVFGLRGHDNSYAEGVTLGGKSHYGTYSNAKMIHTSPALSIRCAHMICSGVVFKKQVLSVCAGLLSNKKGSGINAGPTDYSTYTKKIDPNCTTKATSTIIMSTDPVSADMQAVKVMQMNDGKTYGISDMPKYVQACAGVSGALSGVSYNIGVVDESKMSITKIVNEEIVSPVKIVEKNSSVNNEYLLIVSSLSRQGLVHIDYTVPSMRLGDRSSIYIYDMLGNLLFSKDLSIEGVLNHFVWDLKTQSREMAGRGKYLCKLKIGRITRSSVFTVV
jgi:hypothetical protein